MSCCYVLDLRLAPPGVAHHRYVYSILRDLGPRETMRLWSPEDPTLLMAQLQNHMRHALVWSATTDGQGFLITLHTRGAEEKLSLIDTLRRDHNTLDGRLVHALGHLAAHEWDQAVAEVTDIDRALRTHILLENDLLSPLGSAEAPEPTAIMRREHDDLLVQLDAIAEVCGQPTDQCHELDTWFGLLVATLSKHEFREETLLFPTWERVIARRSDRDALLSEVRSRLHAGA